MTLPKLDRALRLGIEPTSDRLEAALDMPAGQIVPALAAGYTARWTGSILLDLAASDRRVRLGEAAGPCRLFIGRTQRLRDELIDRWDAAAPTSPNLLRAASAAFEVDAVGWSTAAGHLLAGGAVLTRVTDAEAVQGIGSGKIVASAAAQGMQAAIEGLDAIPTFLAGVTYDFTVYLRGAAGGELVQLAAGQAGDDIAGAVVALPGPTAAPLAVHLTWTPTADRSAATARVAVRTTAGAATFYVDRARLTVDAPQTPSLRDTLGAELGWYPIVVEGYLETNAAGWVLEDSAVDVAGDPTGTGWQLVPTSRLSPIGVVEEHFRHEAHRSVIDTLAETFGLQWRIDYATLESGLFPGQMIPRVRVGRDTSKVIDDLAGVEVTVDADAGDTVDVLTADAAGIADPSGAGQLSAQIIDYANARRHMAIAGGYESLAEMSERRGVQTRLRSLLALRSSPNEQVGVRPTDTGGELVDTFALTGELARARWRPGEGVRLALEDVDVVDRTPRQITRVELDLTPDGIAPPAVGFRQRPRSPAAVLKRTLRAVYASSRNYQGTLTLVAGTPGSALGNGALPTTPMSSSSDTYSRLPLPVSLDDVGRVWLTVQTLTDDVAELEVNGALTDVHVNAPGWYDVTEFVARDAGVSRAYARLVNCDGDSEYVMVGRFRV